MICQEQNLPFINFPVPGGAPAPDGTHTANAEAPGQQTKGTGSGIDLAPDGTQGAADASNRQQLYQDSSVLYHFREMQRRQVEFIKKRVLLLEKALNTEYQKEYFVCPFPCSMPHILNSVVHFIEINFKHEHQM